MNRDELEDYIRTARNDTLPKLENRLRALTNERLMPNYVKDENRSVKWNRKYVEDFNANLEIEEAVLKKHRAKLSESIYDELYKYLVEYGEGTITRNDAIRILLTLPEDDYYFNDGAVNTICDCEDIVELFIAHYKELEEEKKL